MIKNRSLVHFTVCPKDCFGSCSLEVEVEKGKVVKVRGNRNSPVTRVNLKELTGSKP